MAMNAPDAAALFFVADLPGAKISASRLGGILSRLAAGEPLTALQTEYLRNQGLNALADLAAGGTSRDAFVAQAAEEQQERLRGREKERSTAQATTEAELRRRDAATEQRNAQLFAEAERKRARRKIFNDFGMGYVEPEDFHRVRRILNQVVGGKSVGTDDLAWLATAGREYSTDELRRAHHRILARDLTKEWQTYGDPWKAVNACAQWRKADEPSEGVEIIGKSLRASPSPKPRSALLTTGGGALRDIGRREEARQYGLEAHGLTPNDYRPCTLLGAVHIEMGDIPEGLAWYEKAEARGASRKQIDQEIRAILAATRPQDRQALTEALKGYLGI